MDREGYGVKYSSSNNFSARFSDSVVCWYVALSSLHNSLLDGLGVFRYEQGQVAQEPAKGPSGAERNKFGVDLRGDELASGGILQRSFRAGNGTCSVRLPVGVVIQRNQQKPLKLLW